MADGPHEGEVVKCPKCGFENPMSLGTVVGANPDAHPPIPARVQHRCLACHVPWYVVLESAQG